MYIALLITSATTEPVWKEPDKTDNHIPTQFYLPYVTLSLAITISLPAVLISLLSHKCFFYLSLCN